MNFGGPVFVLAIIAISMAGLGHHHRDPRHATAIR